MSRTRVFEWFEIFGAGREDLDSRNPETVGETVARDSRLDVKFIYRDRIHQASHEDFGSRKTCTEILFYTVEQ